MKDPELEKKALSKHSNLHEGAISELLLFQSRPLWALNVRLSALRLNVLCSAENDCESLRKKHLPDSLIMIYERQTQDLDLMDHFKKLSNLKYVDGGQKKNSFTIKYLEFWYFLAFRRLNWSCKTSPSCIQSLFGCPLLWAQSHRHVLSHTLKGWLHYAPILVCLTTLSFEKD